MTASPEWLPPLVQMGDYGGHWEAYLEALYGYFKSDFVDSKPTFEGRKLALKRHPLSQGKEATFWHFISEGANEDERTPDFRRCERIRWPRPVIDNSGDGQVKVWRNRRGRENRICVWLESEDYLVILADRGNYLLPWTAYLVEQPHRRRKLQREYEAYWKTQS
jgi:hypothetical protein